ncbi:hypothetical protein FB451DRAFT_1227856, partial [Mycena latifolia]
MPDLPKMGLSAICIGLHRQVSGFCIECYLYSKFPTVLPCFRLAPPSAAPLVPRIPVAGAPLKRRRRPPPPPLILAPARMRPASYSHHLESRRFSFALSTASLVQPQAYGFNMYISCKRTGDAQLRCCACRRSMYLHLRSTRRGDSSEGDVRNTGTAGENVTHGVGEEGVSLSEDGRGE